jgi:hypothetical protein
VGESSFWTGLGSLATKDCIIGAFSSVLGLLHSLPVGGSRGMVEVWVAAMPCDHPAPACEL